MFRTSCWFFVALLFSVNCLRRQFLYSRLGKKVTNSSLAVLYGKDSSLVHCAGLCSGDDYCMEFLYSETSRQCLGLHCVKNKSHQYVVLESKQMLLFKKELNGVEYSGHYYFYGDDKLTWDDAKLECQKKCSHLVEIETEEESDELAATFLLKEGCSGRMRSTCTAWTGGNDLDIEGNYVWSTLNTSMVFTNWNTNEPSLLIPHEASSRDCIDLLRNGKWNDRPCWYLNPFICEKNISNY